MDYKDTVFLPKTNFSMKANLSQKEPDIINKWYKDKLYENIRKISKSKPKYIIHFGPPYANGHIHIGHALSEILKDVVNKSYQMKGYDAALVPGWDCHGLPIEWKIEEQYRAKGLNKDQVDPLEFRQECRAFANKWVAIQKEEFKRLGILADFDNAYSTMDFKTEAKIVEELGIFLNNGSLYRGLKPVMWSVVEKTALAEAEVEYKDHTSDSIMVAFKIKSSPLPKLENTYAVIWTTTPWTLPGNRAISYGDDIDYVIVKNLEKTDKIEENKCFLVAQNLLDNFKEMSNLKNTTIIASYKGNDLKNTICEHPFYNDGYDFDVPLISGDHVTTDAGTGLVHTAPGHGIEDFEVCKLYNIPVPETVDHDGTYYNHVPLFAGQHIFKINPVIINKLNEVQALLSAQKLVHSYPHSWRSKAPLIYRTTSQWFVSMENNDLRSKALQAIETVQWHPASGKNRIRSMVESRPDWCLSRQRAWGTPITVFVHKATGTLLKDDKIYKRIVDAIAQEGADVWFKNDAAFFLQDDYNADEYEKINDILDVWFDSGCTHAFTLIDNPDLAWPADVYLEGSDQHRGWFQSSLLESCGTRGTAPYKNVVTHGFVLDEKGYKMSKSLGNTVTPDQIIQKYGADLLRLWVINSDYTEDLRIGDEILKRQEDIYRRFRNTIRYLLGALDQFSDEEKISYDSMPELECYILHQLKILESLHASAIEKFDFSSFYMALHQFCAIDLSALYFDIRKDALYCDDASSNRRRATRTVMNDIFLSLIHWLAPVLSFTSEEAYQEYQHQKNIQALSSIHLSLFPEIPFQWKNDELAKKWQGIRNVRKVVTAAIEIERANKTIGSSLQAHIDLYISPTISTLLESIDLAELSITSSAKIICQPIPDHAFKLDDMVDVGVVVTLAEGQKCQRCWRVLPEVGDILRQHADICERCASALPHTN